MKKQIAYVILGILLVLTESVMAVHDPKIPEELRVRNGLPNFFAKLKAGGPVRIAYLGGSITAANGWRPKTVAWFESQFPDAELIEINAAISGTGSDYGACRIGPDVLSQEPDLVFMEHRVNGGGGFEAKSVEGIVRQIWQANPRIDICLVYTLSQGMLKNLQAGRQTGFGEVMETLANAYGIPSIDLGVEVAKREKAGDLIFKSNETAEGKLVFSRDGVHPGDAGHDLYRDIVARSMLAMTNEGVTQAHALVTPLASVGTIDEKYAALVVTLPPEEQGWERTLQENLGSFYLPIYKAGRVKGARQAWDYVKDDPRRPRVLLIGEAISQAIDAELTANANRFLPDRTWLDNHGVPINAHGGGVMCHEGTYYWFGEHKIGGSAGNSAQVGVHCYSSTDLYHWQDRGVALAVSDDPASDITRGCILERPKVIYNTQTKRFVMWFHLELKSMGYKAARSGVAVADAPAGPYRFLRSLRPDAGTWPLNVTEAQKAGLKDAEALKGTTFSGGPNPETPRHNVLARDFAKGQMARDMNLFVDEDGKAYHIFASEENSTLHISQLSDDYESHAGKWVRVFENRWHEAPAICKHEGRYWMITSGCTGWAPNAARSAVADSIWGPWKELGNPCVGTNPNNQLGPELTFGAQSTCILPVSGTPGAFIAMFDIWRPENAITGGYVWLPMTYDQDRFVITWHDAWDLSTFSETASQSPGSAETRSWPTPIRAEPLTIENDFYTVTVDAATGRFSIGSRGSGKIFVPSGRLAATGGAGRVVTAEDEHFGSGQSIEVTYAHGAHDSIVLYPGMPFVAFRSTLFNPGSEAVLCQSASTLSAVLDLGKPAAGLRTLGTGGLLEPVRNPGSYAFLAVVDPVSRAGVVGAWLTHDRASGVVFSPVEDDKVTVKPRLDYGRLRIRPNAHVDTETFLLGYFDDARFGLEAYAEAMAKKYAVTIRPKQPGYCTWYMGKYGQACDEVHLAELSAYAAKNLGHWGFGFIQIDDGWQSGISKNGPRKNFTTHDPKGPYPGGMKSTAETISKLNLTPGIWFMPFAGTWDDPFFKDHQDWFVKTLDGKPYDTAWGGTCLDMSHPEARDYVRSIVSRISHEWDYKVFKMDGFWTGSATKQIYVNDGYKEDGIGDAIFFNKDKPNIEVMRDGVKLVREAAGPEVFLLGRLWTASLRGENSAPTASRRLALAGSRCRLWWRPCPWINWCFRLHHLRPLSS